MFSTLALRSTAICGEPVDGVGREVELDAFGLHQRDVLLDEAGFRLGQDADEIVLLQRAQLDADRQAALQLGQQVRRLRHVEGARRDEQDVVGLHRSVFGRDRRAFDERQQVALHAFARGTADDAGARRDLVDLVEEDDAVILGRFQRLADNLVLVEQLVGFVVDQERRRIP